MDNRFSSLHKAKDLAILNGLAFEEFLRQLFTDLGYEAQKTSASGDNGADLLLKKDGRTVVVQAKQYTQPVGIEAVQQAFFAKAMYDADDSWVIATNGFTRSALNGAKKTGVTLVGSGQLDDLIAKSRQDLVKELRQLREAHGNDNCTGCSHWQPRADEARRDEACVVWDTVNDVAYELDSSETKPENGHVCPQFRRSHEEPGRRWLEAFKKRHDQHSCKVCRHWRSRGAATERRECCIIWERVDGELYELEPDSFAWPGEVCPQFELRDKALEELEEFRRGYSCFDCTECLYWQSGADAPRRDEACAVWKSVDSAKYELDGGDTNPPQSWVCPQFEFSVTEPAERWLEAFRAQHEDDSCNVCQHWHEGGDFTRRREGCAVWRRVDSELYELDAEGLTMFGGEVCDLFKSWYSGTTRMLRQKRRWG